jgi:hypothetical protein
MNKEKEGIFTNDLNYLYYSVEAARQLSNWEAFLMRKKATLILMLCVILLIFTACISKTGEVEVEDKIEEETFEVTLLPQEYAWIKFYDQSLTNKIISAGLLHWNEMILDNQFTFTLQDQINKTKYQGTIKPFDEWVLKGQMDDGQSFVLYNEMAQVILEYGEQEELFSQDEFRFLLPQHHLALIQEVVEAQNYELLSWELDQNGANLQIYTKSEVLQAEFNHYLLAHFKLNQRGNGFVVDKSLFERYNLQYLLKLTGEVEDLRLQSFKVILEKDGEIIEDLFFQF